MRYNLNDIQKGLDIMKVKLLHKCTLYFYKIYFDFCCWIKSHKCEIILTVYIDITKYYLHFHVYVFTLKNDND